MTAEEIQAYAERTVADWPPFTSDQRDRLWVLLAPMREALADRAKNRKAAA